jgi:uncharacterized protein
MNALHATHALTDEQVDRLHALLTREELGDNVMDLEALDGFLSALVVGPALVMPSEYLPEIFDGTMPVWESAELAGETIALIQALWNQIVDRLQVDLGDVEHFSGAMPLMAWPEMDEQTKDSVDPFAAIPEGFPLGALWATGFLHGMSLRQGEWDDLIDEHPEITEQLDWIMRLSLVSQEQLEAVGIEDIDLLDHEQRLTAVAQIPGVLQTINDFRLAPG